jgi:leucine-rich repeat protein SHOC2
MLQGGGGCLSDCRADTEALEAFRDAQPSATREQGGCFAAWTNGSHHCEWPGVACRGYRVTSVGGNYDAWAAAGTAAQKHSAMGHLSGCGLTSARSLAALSALQLLDLSSNELGDADFIGKLEGLVLLNLANNRIDRLPQVLPFAGIDTLILSGNRLRGLPDSVGNLSSLYNLRLSNNELRALPATIGQCAGLGGELLVDGNSLEYLPDAVGALTSLYTLNAANNELLALPSSIGHCGGLHVLNVSNNQLQHLPDTVGGLASLSNIHAANNELLALPSSIGGCSGLQQLNVDNNHLELLPDSVCGLPVLWLLSAQDNSLSSLPECTGNQRALLYLILSDNPGLEALPDISGLRALRQLKLDNLRELKQLPTGIEQLDSLQVLSAEHTQLTSLPLDIGNCSGLQTLSLRRNHNLTELPDSIGNLSRLEFLFLDDAALVRLPPSIGQLRSLQGLIVSKNRLTTLPSSVAQMGALEILYLSENRLAALPPKMPSNLRDLRLDSNALTVLPSTLRLPQLASLKLSGNSLTSLPPDFDDRFPVLESLTTAYNNLHALPSALFSLQTLKVVRAQGNRLRTLPDTISQAGSLDLLDVSNNSFTHVPHSIASNSITHLYMEDNPVNATANEVALLLQRSRMLQSFGVSFSADDLYISETWPEHNRCTPQPPWTLADCAPKVEVPQECHVLSPCRIKVLFYDSQSYKVRIGGLLDLTLRPVGAGSNHSIQLVDNQDGSYTGTIPPSLGWVGKIGTYYYQLFKDDQEFWTPEADDFSYLCPGPQSQYTNTSYPHCPIKVKFVARKCSGSNTWADSKYGNKCKCRNGFEPSTAATQTDFSCHKECFGHTTIEGTDGRKCRCADGYYNTSAYGIILCRTNGWVPPDSLQSYQDAEGDQVCQVCPQCANCHGGDVTFSRGWRTVGIDGDMVAAKLVSTRLQSAHPAIFVFHCPNANYGTPDACPSITINHSDAVRASNFSVASCGTNHSGHLCATCQAGCSRKRSDNSCSLCTDLSVWRSHFGLTLQWFIAVMTLAAAVVATIGVLLKSRIKTLKGLINTNLRIVLGLLQVIGLLKEVLNIVYPPNPQHVLGFANLFTLDVHSLVEFDCWGMTWYDTWIITVFVFPGTAFALLTLQYFWRRHMEDADAFKKWTSLMFLVVMVLYPRVSTAVLSALRCRNLGVDASSDSIVVLEADYGILCNSDRYLTYRYIAYCAVIIWPVGIPVGLFTLLIREWLKSKRLYLQQQQRPQASVSAPAIGTARQRLLERFDDGIWEFHHDRVRDKLEFCTVDYRPGCFWFEPVDMLRKLMLSGLLQFIERGTGAQVLVGCAIAFTSFGGQVWLCPYRNMEANVIKTLVDVQLFLTFLISFILRVLPRVREYEPLDEQFYGQFLMVSFGSVLTVAVGLTLRLVLRHKQFRSRLAEGFESQFIDGQGNELSVFSTDMQQHPSDELESE